ncbi:uncharacterized protein BO88DRAFT_405518 [Aspergillus vadensis CBS 113365]|uniref:Uncharacterized protein n=1 Tax=Aspergillus vadensis (strain CBS 113365 / IMI 142717 / IBT 24658) TaxID=1448311 RepID=A0A319B799_ASPVC|nr:hypothetical protein BO88DRAFT_405518 [Aspergillus vadensis CBS 113365]PYH68657.1 hypothetical protein BO88DRAFT_405518 [Aspergillus vadensis CBS 113365]
MDVLFGCFCSCFCSALALLLRMRMMDDDPELWGRDHLTASAVVGAAVSILSSLALCLSLIRSLRLVPTRYKIHPAHATGD